ncbi:muscle-specific protein 300 kDa isoform X4 [Diorhabda carinulata]|uniref:muscle-specific protein 300 kDa isoform X4 n=1 Tax=Diorhabda carinulata TaxID=1163345 RepID=UPI0025A0C8FB|nr:muscle-specific protein 300 kDa isoform X4 [Diorhabda carinulata]
MSQPKKDSGEGSKRPPDSPQSPSSKKLRDRVSFFEKVWTGSESGTLKDESGVDVEELERKLQEERARNAGGTHLEQVTLRQIKSPRHVVQMKEIGPDGSYKETYTSTTEEGDLTTGTKSVKFEKITVKKTVRHLSTSTSSTSIRHITSSRTPSEENIDSAYLTQSNGNLASFSKTSSASSLNGKFPSDESFKSPKKTESRDEWDGDSSCSKVTSSSSEWYTDYRSQSFNKSDANRFEFVRSKSQYDEHIQHIRDEQERVQKKTFVNWINSYLSKRVPPLKIEDLIEDLKDGTKLLALLEVLSGERLPVERGRILRRPHFLSNANTALQFLTSKRIKLVNINASDLVDGRPPVVLGLIWTIILYFQIEENRRQLEYLTQWGSTSSLESAGTTSSRDKWKQGARKTLLNWVSNALPTDSGIEIRDFGASWRDGVAFLAIIDAIKKNLVNIAEMKKATNRARLETAFDVAETELGISKLLDPEDVDVPKPDEKSIMTYVAQFLHKYPEPKSTGPDAIAAIQEEYNNLLSWLMQKTQTLENLENTNSLPLNYKEYLDFKSEVDDKEKLYSKLKALIESQSSVSIAKESWQQVVLLWEKLQQQLLRWLWLLDSRLPGDFKFIGEWLAKAEKLIYCDKIPTVMNEETALIISRKLEEHKTFFVDLPTIQETFNRACKSPLAREVPSEQLENMTVRLNEIGPKAAQRRVRLKFLEHKCCLIAFLQLTESKLKVWTSKYGRVDEVTQLLDQYRNFVSKSQIFVEFQKAYIDMQAVNEEYKRDGNIDKKEVSEIDQFMREIAERWKNVSMELRCVQSMLEEVVAYWRRWDTLSEEFDKWLSAAEKALSLPEEEQMEFFQNISLWRDNYQLLSDTVSFLIATCQDKISSDLKDRFQVMTERWEKIYPLVSKYSHAGDIIRSRKDFRSGLEALSTWLRKAENILGAPSLGSMERIRQHTINLQRLQGEVEEIESLFKNISKAFQGLIQDLSREEVEKMMNTLKQEKEALVKVRALLPSQIHLFNQLLIQQESLESGQREINKWLDEAENLLSGLTLDGDKEQLKEQVDKVKQFFTRTLYYKSMLDSKNKVMNNIIKSVDLANNPDVTNMTAEMDQLNDRFEYVTQNAQIWEHKLQEAIRCWHNFTECERVISSWLNQAEKLTMEKRIDSKETVEQHKNFFQSVNERWIHDLIQSAQDLCNCLPKEQHTPILSSVDYLQNKWKEVLSFAPLHLMKLEFRLDETTFNYYVREIEKEITNQKIMFSRQENVETIIKRNNEFFSSKGPLSETKKSLENLIKISNIYTANHTHDQSLKQSVEKAEQQWHNINIKIENLKQQLDQVPEKWQAYHTKFEEMSKWMDSVDDTLKNILNDVSSMEEFEKERTIFQNVCKEADLKREDMKWLVQTLDSLTSHCPEEQAVSEQKALEALIIRYKNLIPSLEITMVKTDTLSKCYIYRKEVKEICQLLKQVREQSKKQREPESFEVVDQNIKKQEIAISHLDQRRPTIMSLLQKGKELTKDEHAPSFMQQEVKTLETGWTTTYDETVDTLHKLIDTQNVWTNYSEQKQEITQLLEKTQNELQNLAAPTTVPSEIIKKQEMIANLREAKEDTLTKLTYLSEHLSKQVPNQKSELDKEVEQIQQQLNDTLNHVQENVTLLEQYNTKINTISNQLSQVQTWTVHEAPQLLTSIDIYSVTPRDKVEKIEMLQKEVESKKKMLYKLNEQAQQLMINETPEANRLKAHIAEIQEKVNVLNENVRSQSAVVSDDLKNWEAYQASLEEIIPWIENSEATLQLGLQKPGSLEEAVQVHKQTKQFHEEVNQQLRKLQEVAELTQKISILTHAPDEVDSIQTRVSVIQDTAAHWDDKTDKLLQNWIDFDKNMQHLENWILSSEEELSKPTNVKVQDIDTLEKELAKLKAFNNEISEQQAKLISLTQTSDLLSYNISPEGATLMKDEVQELKMKVSNIANSTRAKINEISDAILTKHDFQNKIAEYTNWMEHMKANIAQLDEVPADKLDQTIMNIHTLIQEYSDKQPSFHTIYSEIKEVSLQSPQQVTEPLTEEFSALVQQNQYIEQKLQEKKSQLQKWSEVLNWHTDTTNQLSHIKYQADAEKLTPKDLKKLITETDNILEKLITWKGIAQTIDKSNVVILDKQTSLPRTADSVVREIEVNTINLKGQLGNKVDALQSLMEQRDKFSKLKQEAIADLDKTKSQLAVITNQVKHTSDLPKAVEQLTLLLEDQATKAAIKKKLHSEAMQLMKKDIQNVSVIQNDVSEIERSFNKVNDDIRDEDLRLSDIIFAWNDFQEAKDRIVTDIGKIDKSIENISVPNDIVQANINFEKTKKALDAIKKSKIALEKADSKAQTVIKKSENIPGIESEVKRDLKILNDAWGKIYERILVSVQQTESQSAIWKHIDETKTTLLQWISEQNNQMIKAAEKPNEREVATAKLNKYKEELPAQLRLNQTIPQKYAQLVNTTDNKEIPTLQSLVTLLNEGFTTLEENANQLEALKSTFNENEKAIRNNIKEIGNKVSVLRENIVKCEDLSGDNAKILERLLRIRDLKQELQKYDSDVKNIDQDIQAMKTNYPNFENTLSKEQQTLKKRYDTTVTYADKIEHALLSFLKKFHNDKYGALQRIINTHKEKIQWCLPEATSDKYNLQVKLNALEPIQAVLDDCDKRKEELQKSIKVLEKIENPDSVKLQQAELDHLLLDLENMNSNYIQTKHILENNIALHDQYEKVSEGVINWLKDTENRVKIESSLQMDLKNIDTKTSEITALHEDVKNYKPEIEKLTPLSEELTNEVPESRIGPFVQHLNNRYQAINKFLTHYIDKLHELDKYKTTYNNCIQDVENWLIKAEEKVNNFSKSARKPNNTILEELKNFAKEKEVGQSLLTRAVEHGEALFPGITPENRDTIRAELRNLRDKSEILIDKVNKIYKQVETTLMQRHSFDDSLQQVKLWIDDAELKLGEGGKLDVTLLDKKQTLHNYKILSQDVNLHKTILKQLQDKIGNLSDSEAESKLDENVKKYNSLAEEVENRIEKSEEYVLSHEAYNQAIEKCRDWLSALTNEAALLVDESSTESPEAKLAIVENLLSQKEEGDKIIASCKHQLDIVLNQTAPSGQPMLINNFDEQEKSWQRFLDLCQEAKEKLNEIQSQYAEVSKIMDDLEAWLKSKENFVKDQSLKNTEDTKKTHLEKLKILDKEIQQKEPDFNKFLELSKSLEVDTRISLIPTRYQSLRNAVKENHNKYESYVSEHHDFNEKYNDFLQWLTTKENDLQNFSQIVGDLNILQTRQKDIKDLIDERNCRIPEFETLIDKGEKLYAHTSPDGREIIRQQLKNIRTIWDALTEDLQSASNKLEQCLTQFSDFTVTQEQLTKWLKDVEKAMHQHTELKSTLQEKRAQLQNHQIMHQEIKSHQQLVESVCEKAQQLVDQTQDKSLNIYLQSIKQLFLNIVSKSDELLRNLEECVDRHNTYNQLTNDYKKWIEEQNERLAEYADTTGEKNDINKRIENIMSIKRDSEIKGPQLLESLKQNVIVVAKSTASKGVENLKIELAGMEDSLHNHLDSINNKLDNQKEALKQWDEFDKTLEALNQWIKDTEAEFRDQPLQATLHDKENKLRILQQQREQIAAKEKEIDDFVDKSHALLKCTGSQRIQPITSQMSNRFQNLHTLTKDIINRWQNIVDDHIKYKQRLEETSAWLAPLEKHIQALKEDETTDSVEANNRLQVLLSEAEQGEHKLNSLTILGERLLPDTATEGREIIRGEIKEIRDRWECLSEGIKQQQKLQESQTLQLANYQDLLQQALAWLDSIEKQVKIEPNSWISLQEVRGKLLKHKTSLQEILTHKRFIEGVTEKGQSLAQLTSSKQKRDEIDENVTSINNRYQNVLKTAQNNIKQLEDCMDIYQQFYDLHKAQQDEHKQLWEKLNSNLDYGGNKQVLEKRLSYIIELQDSLPENMAKLTDLETYIQQKAINLPARAQENMQRDVENMKFERQKFVTTLADIKSALENKLKQWNDYERNMDRLLAWLADAEMSLKSYALKSTLEEKQDQLDKYQELSIAIESRKIDMKEFVTITDQLEQALGLTLRQNETEFDRLSDNSAELAQSSGDARIANNVQQILSRFQSVQVTGKEILKKCEQAVTDHKLFSDKYRQCADWISVTRNRYESCANSIDSANRQSLENQGNIIEELFGQQSNATSLLNSTIEMGEKLYPSTSLEGKEIINKQLQELKDAMDSLFDEIGKTDRNLKANKVIWSGFEESLTKVSSWLKENEKQLPLEVELKSTLDEKKAQLQIYRNCLHEIASHQQDILDLKDKANSLPDRNELIDSQFKTSSDQYEKLLKRAQNFVEQYEIIVSNHQQFVKALHRADEWISTTNSNISNLSDLDLDRTSLQSNLERLKVLKASIRDEESRLLTIKAFGDKVILGTIDYGQANIRSEIQNSQKEWAALVSNLDVGFQQLENKLQLWTDYEALKDKCLLWMRETDNKLHSVDLKSTAAEKKIQLDVLKELQGEIKAKELEIDQVTERAQQLNKGIMGRPSQISELGVRYQQICQKIKDLTNRWQQHVTNHQDFDSQVDQFSQWMDDIKEKLTYCSEIAGVPQKELEVKLQTMQELVLRKEEGSSKLQTLVELAQTVLANTAPQGHNEINETLVKLQEEWSNLATSMVESKGHLDDALTKWAEMVEEIKALVKTIELLESQYEELSEPQSTLSEKKNILAKIKTLEEKTRAEKIDVDNLKAHIAEVLQKKKGSEATEEAQETLNRFDAIAAKIFKLSLDKDAQYKDHKLYKEAYDEVQRWMTRAQEKVPQLQRPLSEKLTIDTLAAPLDHLLNKKAQGEVLLENLEHTAQVVLPNTSEKGQELINNDIRALRESFDRLFKDLKQQREQLDAVLANWRDYKDEYEKVSDWLQQIAILIKNQKIALMSNLPEKEKQVKDVEGILQDLVNGKEQIEKLNKTASILLKSPLETHVNHQLQQLNSRYQVELSLANDVLKKVETNYGQHKEYADNLEKTRAWIDNARELIRNCSEAVSHSSRETLQSHLNKIQDLLLRREDGQNLVHTTVNCGEKVLRNTRSDGKEAINNELKEIQNDWERIVKKLSTTKVNLETALLQWADYDSSYSQLQQWITDREAKLQQVTEPKITKLEKKGLGSLPIGDRKATLRETGSILQDIVSFEPMIQSVASKAEDLKQAAPASEISTKYETLSRQAQELYDKQKEVVEKHEAFVDAVNDLHQWIRNARERLGKCSEPTGDKESLGSKLSQLKALKNEVSEGQQKLELAIDLADKAIPFADDMDKEIIEEEVGLLQEDFDNYVENLNHTKSLLEVGIVKWTEYEDQYRDALEWLSQTEKMIQSFNKLQDSLEEKRAVLEHFQLQLQNLFDWQSELDRLNMKAQILLETCADTRVSNAITQISTKYNAILSLAKEIMRRLELHYQEHQQHNALCQECQDWMDRTRDKLNSCLEIPATLNEINNKLQAVKSIRASLEQGQNKLRYIQELKERVIMNTEQSGVAKIKEDTEVLRLDMEKLLNDVQDARCKLQSRANQLEDIDKIYKQLLEWLQEQESQVQLDDGYLNELGEKKAKLEKLRAIQKEIDSHNDLVEKLDNKLQEDSTFITKEYENVIQRYHKFKNDIQSIISNLENEVADHEKYKDCYNSVCDWIRKAQIEIQSCSDLHQELDKIIEKESKILEISNSLTECDDLIHRTIEYSILVMKTTGWEGNDIIRNEIDQLNTDWEGLQFICEDTKKSLRNCKEAWEEFKNSYNSANDAIDTNQKRLNENLNVEFNETNLEKCRSLLEDITALKPQMENLTDVCETLIEYSAISWVRDKTVQLQSKYINLLTNIQSLVSKIEKNLTDQTEFLNIKAELETWLQNAHSAVQECVGVCEEAIIKEKLGVISNIAANMGEGQGLLTKLQEAFGKAINVATNEKQAELRDNMTTLRNSWDQINMDIKSIQAQLKASLARWEEFNKNTQKFEIWLNNTESKLQEKCSSRGQVSEIKTLLERFKNLQTEIQNKETDLDRLKCEGQDLSAWVKQLSVLEPVQQLELRYKKLSESCNAIKESFENELEDYNIYHQKLQETEKWLLQVSFQLMAHNSLYISNREQTEEQLAQHETLLEEIQKYQAILDDVRGKGQAQMIKYEKEAPDVKDTIEKQLSNVQDSYNSLLQTAIQIKNRLNDSLAKFKEYEDTLDSIMQNLDEFEPIIAQEIEKPIENLADAKAQLETAKTLHNKLQSEKSRLAVAVQACEAATASISRPSSPRDTLPPPVPIKELECRARLEDVIDQIQAHLSDLTTSVAEFEEKEKQRNELKNWILSQRTVVTEWKNKPVKLRADAAKQEINNMHDLLTAIDQRRNLLISDLTTSGDENDELEKLLNDLERDLIGIIAEKQANLEIIDEYRQNVQVMNSWFDNLGKRIEAIDKGSGLNCEQKQASILEIKAEFDDQGSKRLEENNRLASLVTDFVNNLDSQQIEEQSKATERRYNEIAKRLQRKLQVLEMTKKGIEDTRNEINAARDWVKEKVSSLRKPEPLGFESRKADDRINALQDLLKEAGNKLVLKETLLKRINNMSNELEPTEASQIEKSLKELENEQGQLIDKIKSEIDRVTAAANTRRNLEQNLEKAKAWIKAKSADLRKLSGYLPLQANQVEKEITQHVAHEADIKQFNEGDLNDLLKLGNSVLKDCDENDRERLQQILNEVKEEFDNLKQESEQKIGALHDLLKGRKQFEGYIEECVNWLKEAEVATSSDIRAANLDVLEEQLVKYEKLHDDANKIQNSIEKVNEQGKAILPTISESDKITLNDTLNSLKNRHRKVADIIEDRMMGLKQNIHQLKEAQRILEDCEQFLQDIQAQLKDLNKPLGPKVEDVQQVISTYDRILKDLKDNRTKLSNVPGANTADLQNLVNLQDDLIKTCEDQLSKLRQLLLLREQYLALITEIMTFITKYTEIVRDIEKSGGSIHEKIQKYDDVISKIQECEALLASASDKGQQIAADGSAQDKNTVTEQLQSLKQALQNLRRAVEKQRQEHENTAAEHLKIAAELEEVLDWLHDNESAVRSRPLLGRDVATVDKELKNHSKLAEKVNDNLNKIKSIQEATKNDDNLPGSIQEQLQEANSLLVSLPRELEERQKYLENNKVLREEYVVQKQKLYDWVKEAEIRLATHKDGVDFENIVQELEEHRIFFNTGSNIRELVNQTIQQAADKIYPSLTSYEQEELSREQQQHVQILKNTLNSAKSQKAQLEQDAEMWKDYCNTLDRVKAVISRTKFIDEPVSTLAGLHFNIQKISHALNDVQNQQLELDLLQQRVNEIIQQADQKNRQNIQSQSDQVSEEWTSLVSDLEKRRDTLTGLAQMWEVFEGRWQNFESLLSSVSEKAKHLDYVVRSKEHLVQTNKSLKELQSEAEGIRSFQEEVKKLSSTILTYLQESSPPSANALSTKLDQLDETYERLLTDLKVKRENIEEDLKEIEKVLRDIKNYKTSLTNLKQEVEKFYVFDANIEKTQEDLTQLQTKVNSEIEDTKDFSSNIIKKYTNLQSLVPSDVAQELNQLELLAESISNAMEEKDREFKKARTTRTDFNNDVDEIQSWIKDAELQIQDRSIEPQILHDNLQRIQSDFSSTNDRLDKLTRNGRLIIQKTRDNEEKEITQSTINALTEQLSQLKSLLDERKQQVGETLDAWQRFLTLYQAVMQWVAEKKVFLKDQLYLSTLIEAKQKLHEYSNAAKSCKSATKNLSDMAKELENIGDITSVGDLPQKMEEAEEAKAEVEATILKRNGLLQETSEEWEQCEKKIKDVKGWIEKTKTALDSPQNKKKPLRDQHGLREKMLADIHIQKTKISLSVEKLQVHFRSGIESDSKVTESAEDLLVELDELKEVIKTQSSELEMAISQVDNYQQEVQQLRQQIVQVEQQLRTTMAPNYLPHDRDQAIRDQQVQKERVRTLQRKLSVRNERMKHIMQRGTPDKEPLGT